MRSNRAEKSEEGRESGRERQAARMFKTKSHCSLFSSLLFLLLSPPPPNTLFHSFIPLSYSLLLLSPLPSLLLSSSLGRISWVSLEGKCNNAPTRWNRARSIISQEMDGLCRAGGGQARTQFRFNKLAKQDPQSDLSLTRRQCLLLRC